MSKICTSLEQSKKLIELGIDVNTADMYMVMKWLREIYGIDIVIEISDPSSNDRKYYCVIWDKNNNSYIIDLFNSYEDAVEEAINYCFENLI